MRECSRIALASYSMGVVLAYAALETSLRQLLKETAPRESCLHAECDGYGGGDLSSRPTYGIVFAPCDRRKICKVLLRWTGHVDLDRP